jgi:HK97 family phage major capsid protein
MELKEVEKQLTTIEGQIKGFIDKYAEEMKVSGAASTETKSALDKLGVSHTETQARLMAIEQKITAPNGGGPSEDKSIGQMVIESEGYKSLAQSNSRNSTGKISVKSNLINATGQNQPLVQAYRRPGIQLPGLRRLTVRDLLPSTPISSNLVEYVKEASFTNNAAMQTAEAVAKAESAITFSMTFSAVQTLAHWIPVSRQLLEDAPAIQGYVNNRLMYGLKLAEEAELLTGSGAGVHLSGLITNATTFDTTQVNVSADTFIDVLLRAKTQVQISYFEPDFIVLHPRDWERIQLIKTAGTASSGEYIFADPHTVQAQSLWGLSVVSTQSMPESQFLVGASMAAMIWDRNQMTVEISREHASFFIENMAAILVEERLALTVFRPEALVYGGFPFGS